jgi:AraC family transcriptional regulator
MPVSEILRFPNNEIAFFPGQHLLRKPIDIIADEEQWRVRPQGTAPAFGQRVLGTRWRVFEAQAREAAALTPDDCHVIGIPLRSTNLRLAIAGRTVLDGAVMPGTPLVAGPGTTAKCFFRGPCDELHLHVPNELIAECARDIPGAAPELLQRETVPTRDPMIERLGWTLLLGGDENGGSPVGQLYVDYISLAIIARLLGSTQQEAAAARAGRATALPRWRLKRAIDHIESRLDETITLADLAAAAGLTRMHFAAQFRVATGLRPHEYLLRRRIERAQELLLATATPVVEIALSVGFQTQSHFTTVFKRFTGQPPLAWRQSQPRPAAGEPQQLRHHHEWAVGTLAA